MRRFAALSFGLFLSLNFATASFAQSDFSGLKADAVEAIEARSKMVQEIVDSLFSFSELGFQEFETQRYLTDIPVSYTHLTLPTIYSV